jgi:WD40 repeat protein
MTAVRLSLTAAVAILTATVGRTAPPAVTALAYHSDGSLLAAGTHGQVTLIDPRSGEDVGVIRDIPGRITGLAFSKAGPLAVACGEPGKAGLVRLYDLAAGRSPASAPLAEIAAHKDAVYGLAFRPDGRELATAGYDRVIKVWTVGQPNPRLTLSDHSDAVYAVAYSPDGKLLASAAADRAVKVWDVSNGKRLYTLGDPTDWVYAVAWHPGGKMLAAAGVDRSIRVWEATADGGRLIRSAFAHEQAVTWLGYGPDGSVLYSAGEDGRVKAWDATKLTETRVLPKQSDAVPGIALRPDGKQLAVGRFDGTAQFIDPATGKPGATFLPVKPRPPAVSAVTPDAVVRGGKARLTLTGSRLDTATGLTISDPAIKARLLPGTNPGSRGVELDIPAAAAVGPVRLTLASPAGESAPARVVVDRYAAVPERGATDSAHAAMAITLPATVVGAIDRAGDVDYFHFDARAGQQVGVQVVAAALGSKFDPVLTLSDDAGQVVAEATASALGYTVPKAGAYAVGVRDREYRGGKDMTYRLHVGDVPVVTAVFPLGVQRGKSAVVHIDGVNLGPSHGPTATVHVPADATVGSKLAVPVPPTAAGDRPLGAASIVTGEFPAAVVAAEAGADLRDVPGTADGILSRPGEAQTIRFPAKKGTRLVIETHASRLGSPLDPVIEVTDSAGKPVPRATLRCTAKTFLTFRDHDDAKPGLRLDAWNELTVNDYIYAGTELMRIKALPGHPDADCDFVQVGGRRVAFLDTTPTHHAHNTPMYKVEIHPPGTTFPPNGMPVFTLYYRNDDGGPGYGKDARVFFDPPADGVYQVRVADAREFGGPAFAYRLTVRPPRPDFAVAVSPATPNVWRGGAVPVTITATRIDGYAGPIDVRFDGLSPGFTVPPTRVEAEQVTTAVALHAAADAPAVGKGQVRLVAKAVIDGREVVREVPANHPKAIDGGDIVTTTDAAALSIVPGREVRFVATIERRNGFAGRVPLDVRGLPHGVTVQNIGLNGILITEKETRREVVLRAEPWVKPTEVPIVVFARNERKGTEHAARSVTLKVGQ